MQLSIFGDVCSKQPFSGNTLSLGTRLRKTDGLSRRFFMFNANLLTVFIRKISLLVARALTTFFVYFFLVSRVFYGKYADGIMTRRYANGTIDKIRFLLRFEQYFNCPAPRRFDVRQRAGSAPRFSHAGDRRGGA